MVTQNSNLTLEKIYGRCPITIDKNIINKTLLCGLKTLSLLSLSFIKENEEFSDLKSYSAFTLSLCRLLQQRDDHWTIILVVIRVWIAQVDKELWIACVGS